MILDDDDIIALLSQGIDTVPMMAYRLMDLPPIIPSRLDMRTRRDFRRLCQRLHDRLNRMEKWHEVVSCDPRFGERARVWRLPE